MVLNSEHNIHLSQLSKGNLMLTKPILSIKSMLQMRNYGNFASELPYFCFISDKNNGAILLNSASLIMTFEYRGKDLESSTNNELNSTAYHISQALLQLGEGWSIHVDIMREEAKKYIDRDLNLFGKNITAEVLDEESRLMFQSGEKHYENKYYLTFCYIPPRDMIQKIDSMFYENTNNNKAVESSLDIFNQTVEGFFSDLRKITSLLSASSFSYFDVLGKDDTLSFLNKCICSERQFIKSNYPSHNYFLQYTLSHKEVIVDNFPKVGDKYLTCVTIYGFPNAVYPGILDQINTTQMEYRFNTRFIFVSNEKALSEIKKVIQKWKTKRKGGLARIMEAFNISSAAKDDSFAVGQEEEAESTIEIIRRGDSKYGFYTSTVVMFNEDLEQLKEQRLELYTIIQQMGFTANLEDVNNFDAYMGSLPGNTFENVVQLPIFTHQLSDLFPITALWTGADRNPSKLYLDNGGKNPPLAFCKTTGNTPFKLNLFHSDVGHSMVVGPAGSGKSVLLNFLISQHFRYKDAKVFLFDKGRSSKILCYAYNGKFYDIIHENEQMEEHVMKFQPLARLDTTIDRTWAEQWLENIVRVQGEVVDVHVRKRIKEALMEMADYKGDKKHNRTMSTLCNLIQDNNLKELFQFYTSNDSSGKMFDGNSDSLELSNFTVFEMSNLLSMGDKTKIIPLIEYFFRQIELNISLNPTPSLIVLDEAWVFLDHPVFREKIKMWLKEMRKYNCAVIFATQNLSDAFKSEIADTLIQECPTKILLANPEAVTYAVKPYYEKLGLNPTQIEIISQMTQKRDYYMIQKTDRRLFNLGLNERPALLNFIGRTSKDDSDSADIFKQKFGDEFAPKWLEACQDEYNKTGNTKNNLTPVINSWYKLHNKQFSQG